MRPWMCFLVIAVAACGGKKQEEPGVGSGTAVQTAAVQADAAAEVVEVFVGDSSVAKVPAADLERWPRLDSLLPEDARRLGTWEAVAFVGAAPAAKLERPSQNHPDKVPVLFRGKDGKPAFGMFDAVELARRGEPGFRVDGVREVRITLSSMERGGDHQGSTGEGADPMKLVVKIKTADGEKQLTGPEILKLPRQAQPGSEDTKGWSVMQFLEAVGVTKFESITLVDANGATVPLTKKELDPENAVPFVKLNKQGALRFRLLTKQGEGWQAGADLRALVAIHVK